MMSNIDTLLNNISASSFYEKVRSFLHNVVEWAETQPEIRGIALVGSFARGAGSESSDIDLVLTTTDPDFYLKAPEWITHFGEPLRQATHDLWGKVRSIRVLYDGLPEVEFGWTTKDWVESPIDEGTQRVILDGLIVLYDPDGDFAFLAE